MVGQRIELAYGRVLNSTDKSCPRFGECLPQVSTIDPVGQPEHLRTEHSEQSNEW
jgi:hypothetical protein